jgi:outer membrane protein TolC
MRAVRAVATVRVVAVVAAVVAGTAAAQETPVPARLTLEDAIAIARERSPELAQARNSLNAQGSQVRAGFGAFLPSLNAQLNFGGSDSRTVSGLDDFGQPVEWRRRSSGPSRAAPPVRGCRRA